MKIYYTNLSYQGKIKLILNIVFAVITLFIVVTGLIFSKVLSNQIYESNQEKLSVMHLNMKNELEKVATVSDEIHKNGVIQDDLMTLKMGNLSTIDRARVSNRVRNELSWMLVDNEHIIKTLLIDSEERAVVGNTQKNVPFFSEYFLSDILKKLDKNDNQAKWLFNEKENRVLYFKNIYSTRSTPIRQVGVLLLEVNMSFINDFVRESGLFNTNDFFVLRNGNEMLRTNPKISFQLASIDSFENDKKGNSYSLEKIGNEKYYIHSNQLQIANQSFKIYSFLVNKEILNVVFRIVFFFFIVSLFFITIGYYYVNRNLNNLIRPIRLLAENMRSFETEKNLVELIDKMGPMNVVNRTDEIGILYAAYKKLLLKIDELILKNYQSKILTKEIEYKYLRAQIEPHFLYNTLHSINWMAINSENDEISEMVTSLALLLRRRIDDKSDFITVKEELEIVEAYINIQSIRYQNRLLFSKTIDDKALSLSIPTLTIQPLIENSIKYGVEKLNRPVTVQLRVSVDDSMLKIQIEDDGPGFIEDNFLQQESTGLGIHNIRERLAIFFGDRAIMTISSNSHDSTVVEIRISINDIVEKGKG